MKKMSQLRFFAKVNKCGGSFEDTKMYVRMYVYSANGVQGSKLLDYYYCRSK